VSWWCSADGKVWTWEWRPYLGAWLLVGALFAFYFWAFRADRDFPLRRKLSALAGIVVMLIATDWPVASLGAGYLLSVQMGRQVLIVLIAIPLLMYGCPPAVGRWLEATRRRRSVTGVMSNPMFAIVVAPLILLVVNTPLVSDRTIVSALGSFGVDVLWIVAGVVMWFPVQPPEPMKPRLVGPLALGYLFIQSILPLPISFFMTWADYPLFGTFELAPRVFQGFSATDDQELAAGMAQVVGGLIIWFQITWRFLHWAILREREDNATVPHFIRQAEARDAKAAAKAGTSPNDASPTELALTQPSGPGDVSRETDGG
jgi:putative membrane protein